MMDSRYRYLACRPALFWDAIATNIKAYDYYRAAKEELFKQSIMRGKRGGGGGGRGAKRRNSNGTTGTPNAQPQHPANGGQPPAREFPPLAEFHTVDISNQFGVTFCPECKTKFNDSTFRPVQEGCGHIKCRSCLIRNEDGCKQCKRSATSPISTLVVTRTAESQFPSANAITHGSSSNNVHSVRPMSPDPTWGAAGDPINQRTPPKRKILSNSVSQEARLSFSSSLELTPLNSHNEYGVDVKRCRKKEPPLYYVTPIDATAQCKTELGCEIAAEPRNGITIHRVNRQVGQPLEILHSHSSISEVVSTYYNQPPRNANPTHVPDWTASLEVIGNANHVQVRNSSHISDDSEGSQLGTICPSQLQQLQLPGQLLHNEARSLVGLSCENSNSTTDDAGENSQKNNTGEKKKKKRSPVFIHEHIKILTGDPQMYQCSICTKKFKTKAHIKYHEFCQNGEKPFRCDQCGQGFIAKSHYEYHLRTHTGERPYVCPKCGKGFNQRGKVTRHMRSHTGEKPFHCDTCGRGFANAQAMRSHFLTHTGERPFACEHCNKRFTGMTNLKKHIITHTGERPFMCGHCGKSFGLKWTLDLHMRTHSSERPYACDQCSRAFSNSKDLRRHLVIHSGERPFKCWLCGTAFRRKDNLDRHIKNTHNQTREVAKQLANQAAAEYLAATKAANDALASGGVGIAIASSSTSSSPIKMSSLVSNIPIPRVSPTTFRRINAKKTKTSRPPSTVPPGVSLIDAPDNSDLYILPNDGLNVPTIPTQIEPVEAKPEISNEDESTSSTELYTELRPVQQAATEEPPITVRRVSCEEPETTETDTDTESQETTVVEAEQPALEKVDDKLRSGTVVIHIPNESRSKPNEEPSSRSTLSPNEVSEVENASPGEPLRLLSSGSASPDTGSHGESSGKMEIDEFLRDMDEQDEEDILAIPPESLIGWRPAESQHKIQEKQNSEVECNPETLTQTPLVADVEKIEAKKQDVGGETSDSCNKETTKIVADILEDLKSAIPANETGVIQLESLEAESEEKLSTQAQKNTEIVQERSEACDEVKPQDSPRMEAVGQVEPVKEDTGDRNMGIYTEDTMEQKDYLSEIIAQEDLVIDENVQVPIPTDATSDSDKCSVDYMCQKDDVETDQAPTSLSNSGEHLEAYQKSPEPNSNSEENTASKQDESMKPSESDPLSKSEEVVYPEKSPNAAELDSFAASDFEKSPKPSEAELNDSEAWPKPSQLDTLGHESIARDKSPEPSGQDSNVEELATESEELTCDEIITSQELEAQDPENAVPNEGTDAPAADASTEVSGPISPNSPKEGSVPALEAATSYNSIAGIENGSAAVNGGGSPCKSVTDDGEDLTEDFTLASDDVEEHQAELQENTTAARSDGSLSDPEASLANEIDAVSGLKLELQISAIKQGSPSSACSTSSHNSESPEGAFEIRNDAKEGTDAGVEETSNNEDDEEHVTVTQVSRNSSQWSHELVQYSGTDGSTNVSLKHGPSATILSPSVQQTSETLAVPLATTAESTEDSQSFGSDEPEQADPETSAATFPMGSVRDYQFQPWENSEALPPGYITVPRRPTNPADLPEFLPQPELMNDPFADGTILLCAYSRFMTVPDYPGRQILQFCETLGYRVKASGSPEYVYAFVDSPQEITHDADCTIVLHTLVTDAVVDGHLVLDEARNPLITGRVAVHKFNEYKMQLPFYLREYSNGLRIITMLSQNPTHLAMIQGLQGFRYMLMQEYCCHRNTAVRIELVEPAPPVQNGVPMDHSRNHNEETGGKSVPMQQRSPELPRSTTDNTSYPLELVVEGRTSRRSPEMHIGSRNSSPAQSSANFDAKESRLLGLARAIAQVGEMDRLTRREHDREMAAKRHAHAREFFERLDRMDALRRHGSSTSTSAYPSKRVRRDDRN